MVYLDQAHTYQLKGGFPGIEGYSCQHSGTQLQSEFLQLILTAPHVRSLGFKFPKHSTFICMLPNWTELKMQVLIGAEVYKTWDYPIKLSTVFIKPMTAASLLLGGHYCKTQHLQSADSSYVFKWGQLNSFCVHVLSLALFQTRIFPFLYNKFDLRDP